MRWVLGLVIGWAVLAACAADGTIPQLSVTPAPVPGRVVLDPGLGLGPEDRLVLDFSIGIWRGVRDGDVVTLTERHLFGDESGVTTRLEVAFGGDEPVMLGAASIEDSAGGNDRTTVLGGGLLTLQDADPAGVVSGRYEPDSGRPFEFWVDLHPDTLAVPERGVVFDLLPGGVIDLGLTHAIQYVGVVEDSRCPPGATCVWAGEVAVEMRAYSAITATRTVFELRGLEPRRGGEPPGAGIFGDAPSAVVGSHRIILVECANPGATFVVEAAEG